MKERIMVIGPAGSGKTRTWLNIASHFPSKQFYCIDSDDSVERMLTAPEFSHLSNVHAYKSSDWKESETHLKTIREKIRDDDWVIVDLICSQWDFVQNFFVEQVFGKPKDEYFLEVRRALKPGERRMEALKGWVDWNVINALYQDWINTICYRMKANVFLAAKGVPLSKEDDKDTKDIFSHLGMKPEGEKRNIFRVHTLLMLRQEKMDEWSITTVKDRARTYIERVKLRDFSLQYGVLKAGWEVEE